MTIANMNSTAAEGVLLKSSLNSSDAITSPIIGAVGVVVNEVSTSFTDGYNPNTGGDLCKVSFDNIDPDDRLAFEGQIVIDVTAVDCAQNDAGSVVTQTAGIDQASAAYLWAMENSAGGDMGRCFIATNNLLNAQLLSTDTLLQPALLTIDKDEFVTLCFWWKGNEWGMLADGGILATGTRQTAHPADNFYKIVIGTAWNGTSTPFANGRFKNLIVSYVSPRLQHTPYGTISILGDSYAGQLTDANDASFMRDINADGLIHNRLSRQGLTTRIYANTDGGASIGDSALNNLSALFDTWALEASGVVWLIAFNNDYLLLDADRNDGSTGTEANAQKVLKLLGGELATATGHTYTKVTKVILCTGGSLTNNIAVDTAAYKTGKAETQAIINSLVAWWDAAYPAKAGLIEIYDLFTGLGGDSLEHRNYQGYIDTFGNETQAPNPTQGDRHPSSHGRVKLVDGLLDLTR